MKLVARSVFLVGVCAAQLGLGADPLDSWTASNLGIPNGLGAMTFGSGKFVAVGNTVATSPDGVTWMQGNSGITNAGLFGIVYGGGEFVAVGGDPQFGSYAAVIATSPDGITWTQRSSGTTNAVLSAVAYGNGQYVAVGYDGNNGVIVSSSDAVNWATRVSSTTRSNLPPAFTSVGFGNGTFVALAPGSSPPSVATSSDAINWTITPGGVYSSGPTALTFGNGQFVAAGGYPAMDEHSNPPDFGTHFLLFTSPDGINWTQRTNILSGAPSLIAFTGVAYGGGEFVAVGPLNLVDTNGRPMVYSSPDGTNWLGHDLGIGPSAVGYGNGQFIGLAGTNVVQSGVIGKLGASLSPASGIIQGTITGVTGQSYAIKASTNLAAWGLLTNVTINTNGVAQFSDPLRTSLRQRFYQALLAQQ